MPWLIIFLVAVIYWNSEPDTYQVFGYPNADNLTHHVELGIYEDYSTAQSVAYNWEDQMWRDGFKRTDYEIGKNCEPSPYGLWICEETTR